MLLLSCCIWQGHIFVVLGLNSFFNSYSVFNRVFFFGDILLLHSILMHRSFNIDRLLGSLRLNTISCCLWLLMSWLFCLLRFTYLGCLQVRLFRVNFSYLFGLIL